MNKERIFIFGTGKYYEKYKNRFKNCCILALIDNSIEKQGKVLDKHKIIKPEEIQLYNYDFIVILIQDYEEVVFQLLKLNIPKSKIITFQSESFQIKYKRVLNYENIESGDILLFSHQMSLTGAPLMLFEMGKIMRNLGCKVSTIAMEIGDLADSYCKEKINTFFFDDFQFTLEEAIQYFSSYKLIVVNTVTLYYIIPVLIELNIPIIWWLHEEWGIYKELNVNWDIIENWDNLHVYSVGKRAEKAFKDFVRKQINVENLQWGIPQSKICATKKNKKPVVAIIGQVNRIKGQDLICSAIENDIYGIYEKIDIWIIGHIDKSDREMFEKYSCIKIFGEIGHEELLNLYQNIDIVLSTSRHDTMPVVLVEGFMNKKLCITSDGTGISDYVTQYEDGIVYRSEDVERLNQALSWAIQNRKIWDEIGKKAYALYNKFFSMESFETSVKKVLDQYLH